MVGRNKNKNPNEYFVDFLKDKRYRADGVLMPCCFNKKIQKKIYYQTIFQPLLPALENQYSQPYNSFKTFFNQTDNYLTIEKKSGVSKSNTTLIVKEN